MVHDPRAPRLAAVATLVAAILVILTAVNLVVNAVGTNGFSSEEGVALGGMLVMLGVANLASKERVVPELTLAQPHPDAEAFDTLVSSVPAGNTGSVNPTTASILTSILGESQSTDQVEVNTAISTLSSGEFGAEVQRTIAAVEAANQTNIAPREASPTDEETGQTLERVLVKAVPLPGQQAAKVVDPGTIPGLEPGRAFVTSGVSSVPLPTQVSKTTAQTEEPPAEPASHYAPSSSAPSQTAAALPAMPNLDDLFIEAAEVGPQEPAAESAGTTLPDLDDLFAELPKPQPSSSPSQPSVPGLPDLPDLDDLF